VHDVEAIVGGLRYDIPTDRLTLPQGCVSLELRADDDTVAYVEEATRQRHGRLRTMAHRALSAWMSDFDVNALLRMYPMFLLSGDAFSSLLGASNASELSSWLDVGAGSGDVTRRLAPAFDRVHATETSRGMARRLTRLGFSCDRIDLGGEGIEVPGAPYDAITLFNVIDRAPTPATLVRNVVRALAPQGRLVLATPLPFRPFYYDGPRTEDPREALGLEGQSWEEDAGYLLHRTLPDWGLRPRVVSRVPYLSGGDAHRPLYVLDDLVVVCSAAGR